MKQWLVASVFVACAYLATPSAGAIVVHSSLDIEVAFPPEPVRLADRTQLVYELHIRNFAREALSLQRLEALADDGSVLADFGPDALAQRLGGPGARNAPEAIEPGALAVAYLELPITASQVPRTLRHRLTVADTGSTSFVVESERVTVPAATPLVLAPPLRGGPWAAIYDPSWKRGHRRMHYAVDGRARIPGRHAIDWVRVDAGGRKSSGDQDRVANWHGYGAEVLAVADAVVAAVRDDVEEKATVSGRAKHALGDAAGNYVALDLGNSRYAFYEHLKPGSVRVRPGQPVRRGQVIGALGFTGDSTGPHLHFHVANANSPLAAEGVPFVFETFEWLGRYEVVEQLGRAPWQPIRHRHDSARHDELPAPNSVVMFDASDR